MYWLDDAECQRFIEQSGLDAAEITHAIETRVFLKAMLILSDLNSLLE